MDHLVDSHCISQGGHRTQQENAQRDEERTTHVAARRAGVFYLKTGQKLEFIPFEHSY